MKKSIKMLALLQVPLIAFLLVALLANRSEHEEKSPVARPAPGETAWVDSVYNAMTEDERLGQLFMIRAHSDLGPDHVARVEDLIRQYHVGGLCFFQGEPEAQAKLVNRYQQLNRHVPLLVAIDGEWGLGMRMRTSTISFPRQLTLGAIQDNELIYEMGREIAHQMKLVGVNVNFAPVVDVNNNRNNPVINFRSFGEDRYNVTAKAYQYMKGMQDGGILACAKHFPGHGDTDVDSHHDLPVINHSMARLDSIELYPFKALIDRGVGSIMIAHLNVPALDDRPNRPTTLSRPTTTDLLRKKLGFDGLVFTDALEMKGVTKHFRSGEVEAEALRAGNDILTLPEDMGAALKEIRQYLADGRLDPAQVEASVRRVLRIKYRLGLTTFTPLATEKLRAEINRPEAMALKQRLLENAMTLVRNKDNLIPFQKTDSVRLASLSIGAPAKTPFQQRLSAYASLNHLQTGREIPAAESTRLKASLKAADAVIVSLHDMNQRASENFGLTRSAVSFVNELAREKKVILVVFGNPYSLKDFDAIDWVLEAYEDDGMTQDVAAQALFGAFPIRGRLPVSASAKSSFNTGMMTPRAIRLGYAQPERVGLSSDTLARISELARMAIDSGATPGCVVLVAKDGKVVYHEAFGYHTYDKQTPTARDDIFDMASITKIAASTISVMRLVDEGRIDIDQPLSRYLPELKGSNKEDMIIRDMMAHHAGLRDWIRFYEQTLAGSKQKPRPSTRFYHKKTGGKFVVPVTESLYMRQDFVDSMWDQIIRSELNGNKNYKYSDLGFYLLSRTIERLTGQPVDQYAAATFYQPLGLQTATYNPWQKYPLDRIVPTEHDVYWRQQEIHGYVHDMGAAMLGGVSGHAGLFCDANDLAILMQMLLQGGEYGGRSYLRQETIREFTTRFKGETRRGIGFDMLETDPAKTPNLSSKASARTFGHLGFTGTAAWVDPEQNLIFLFLSNRTYPSMFNRKLDGMNIRPRIQSVVYDALMR